MKDRWYKDQLVFYRCLNPGVGQVQRQSDDHGWVDIKWIDGGTGRYPKDKIIPLNGVLNYWYARETGQDLINATIPRGDLTLACSNESHQHGDSTDEI